MIATHRHPAHGARKHLLFFLLLISLMAISEGIAFQPGKDGNLTVTGSNTIVNDYALMEQNASAGAGQIRMTNIADLPGLAIGDLLLIYQAQGASISTVDSYLYGTVTNLNGAGRYELVTVTSLPSNSGQPWTRRFIGISTSCGGLENSYNVSQGAVQIIRVPQYENVTIQSGGRVRPMPWNGTRGGVVAMHVNGTLTINDGGSVDASARGFRGGAFEDADVINGTTTYISTDPNRGAFKGEGIAGNLQEDGARARGAAANGGGGGNDHNAGGGGGANAGDPSDWTIGSGPGMTGGQGVMNPGPGGAWVAGWELDPSFAINGNALTTSSGGGRGGYTWGWANQNPTIVGPGAASWNGDNRREVGGLGGRPLVNDPEGRLFLGGGGGAGHSNNDIGGRGGNGGGLVFIIANQVEGEGSIESNGENGQDSGTGTIPPENDAPGGAGAGGTIILRANNIADTMTLRANGGTGGNQFWDDPAGGDETEGPGGGGGGGYIAVSGGTPQRLANGGESGLNDRTFMLPFAPNGATDGGAGQAHEQVNFINLCAGTISGRVFSDYDGNALQEGAEPGLAGIPVLITPASGAPFTVYTDADGNYNALVPIGSTTAVVDTASGNIPAGSAITTGLPGGNATQTVTVTNGNDSATDPVGFQQRQPVMELSETPLTTGGDPITGGVGSGATYDYVLAFSNAATPSTQARATSVGITVTLPRVANYGDQLTLEAVTFDPAFPGTWSLDAATGILTILLTGDVEPGEAGTVTLRVKTVNPVPNQTIVNHAELTYADVLGNPMDPLTDNSTLDVTPLLVVLERFELHRRPSDSRIVIEWTTAAEFAAAGFDIYRLGVDKQGGPALGGTRITPSLIPAMGSPIEGATYSFIDPTPHEEDTPRGYYLVETELGGGTLTYGPVWYLPEVSAHTALEDWKTFD